MPVESAFKLHLITLNRDRLARVMASLGQKLVFLKVVLTGPQMSHAQLQLRTLTPQSQCHTPASPSPLCLVEKLFVHTFSFLLVSESLELRLAESASSGLPQSLWNHQQGAPIPWNCLCFHICSPTRKGSADPWLRAGVSQLHCLHQIPGSAMY